MTKILDAFTAPDGSRRKAFIPFITAGDPTIATTERLVLAMAEAGADLIELGIPFSDPTAEGPVIQDANLRALKNKVTTDDVFAMVELIREANPDIPCAVGFGISSPEQAKEMAGLSDGAIVGSGIVRIIAEKGEDSVDAVADYVRNMAAATHAA